METQLGNYQILGQLGAGGMGVVYRARDTRLNRDVAIKVLPADFAQDADRLRRFELEAKATGSLNHPNILTIYDIGTHDGSPYLVAELLEGQELRAQLNNGALPMKRAIDYAGQIAAGLTAAHAKGIVHRDLKPENLFVTKDGRIKILDFGLAKMEPPNNVSAGSDVATLKQLTTPGTVMGTVAYMSPEQVRGEVVDARSDLFSFGLILYEMLTGKRAFDGASMADLMSAILKEEPPELSATNPQIHPQLEKIVQRCLEKKAEMRFQTASDLGFALSTLTMAISSGKHRTQAVQALDTAATAKRGGGRERIAWLVAGVATLLALIAFGAAYFNRSATDMRAVRLAFAPPENLAFNNGQFDYVIVSPDGQKLVFTGRSADGKRQLYVRPLEAADATPLPGTDDALSPFWSPDSRSIGFGSQGKLKRIDLAGGRPQTLCNADRLEGGTWNRAGVIVFAPTIRGGLFQIPAAGGEPTPVTSLDPARLDRDHLNPHFLPDGRHFLFSVVSTDRTQRVFAGSLDAKDVKQVLADAAPAVYAPPGWLLFLRNGALLAQSFDAAKQELKGEAFPFSQPTNSAFAQGVPFSISENGVLVWQGDRRHDYQLVWFDREGKQGTAVGSPLKVASGQAPALAPDGKRAAIFRNDAPTQNDDIWIIDLARNIPTRLTTDPTSEQIPIWSPDGSRVLYSSQTATGNSLYLKAASGLGAEELLLKSTNSPTDWSADGRFILYQMRTPKTRRDVWALPLFGDRQPYPLLNSEFDEYRAQLSPDGRWLVYVSDESGSYEIYVQPFTADGKLGNDKKRISTSGGNQPRFRGDGRELFYVAADGQMMAVALQPGGATLEFEPPKALFKTRMLMGLVQSGTDYDVTADGQRFLIGTQVGESSPVTVFLHWTEGLKK